MYTGVGVRHGCSSRQKCYSHYTVGYAERKTDQCYHPYHDVREDCRPCYRCEECQQKLVRILFDVWNRIKQCCMKRRHCSPLQTGLRTITIWRWGTKPKKKLEYSWHVNCQISQIKESQVFFSTQREEKRVLTPIR